MAEARVLAAALTLALWGGPARAVAETPGPMIAQGQDRVIRAMLGGDDTLEGGCRLDRADIVRAEVVASYGCEGGEVALLALVHPAVASPAALAAGPVAVERRRADEGPELGDAQAARLAAVVAARAQRLGAEFRWMEPAARAVSADTAPAPETPPAAPAPPPRPFSPYAALTLAVAATSALAALARSLLRRRATRP